MLSNAPGFGRIWPAETGLTNITTQVIGASRASQTYYIAIAPGVGVFDPLRHYGRFTRRTRPPGEVAGPPIGVHGYSA